MRQITPTKCHVAWKKKWIQTAELKVGKMLIECNFPFRYFLLEANGEGIVTNRYKNLRSIVNYTYKKIDFISLQWGNKQDLYYWKEMDMSRIMRKWGLYNVKTLLAPYKFFVMRGVRENEAPWWKMGKWTWKSKVFIILHFLLHLEQSTRSLWHEWCGSVTWEFFIEKISEIIEEIDPQK